MKTLEETNEFKPKFDDNGLITCVTKDAKTGQILMVAYMNEESLAKTLALQEMVYWSRSRNELWHKGATSGQIQSLVELRTDCDQDCMLAFVELRGKQGACHTGRDTCFYRRINKDGTLEFIED